MRVLIVAKTRRGTGACVGGIGQDGRSVRLVAANAATNQHAGMEYEVGEVWEIEADPDPHCIPPHVENIIVRSARQARRVVDIETHILRFMPPVEGGPELLFEGRLQSLSSGGLYIAQRTGLPRRSTQFWRPDRPLERDAEGKRIRYRYPTSDGGRTLTFVGFQEPFEVIPAGTLLRVSLAHWWQPPDRPSDELRCHAQLSGWFLPDGSAPAASRAAGSPAESAPRPKTDVPDLARARKVLKQTFGFENFLQNQADIVSRALQRRDTLVVMPTGGGKSLCYQLPALLLDGLTVVISPLIALMQDQVNQLQQLAVPAAFLNSTLALAEHVAIARRVRRGEVRILYVAPETLLRPEILVLLEESRLACLAIDEAHCISEWGHDFRPEYRQIQTVRQRFPKAVCVALTATATARVRQDIRRLLGIGADGEFVASFDRPNLFLGIQPRRDGLSQALAFLERHRGQAGIIYCSTKKQVDRLSEELRARGWPALAYHAGMEPDRRRGNQDEFIRGDETIMVATVAFGMGINKSNVRFVLHYNLPRDLESYYQEIGRAGRDGLPAECLMLHSRADAVTIRRFIDEGAADERPGRQARLDALVRYAETNRCRREPLLAYFGETHTPPCGRCDNCRSGTQPREQTDVTEPARKFLKLVQQTGESFGPAHLIDVLRGSQSQRVLARGHHRLAAHGTGRELTTEAWRDLVRQFLEQGILEQDLQFGGLRLTVAARAVMNGGTVFVQRADAPSAPPAGGTPEGHDPALFDLLRRKRRQLADQAGLPAYIIFSDRALTEMATKLPRNAAQFLAINGVGKAKLEKYGDTFLRLIRDYLAQPERGEKALETRRAPP